LTQCHFSGFWGGWLKFILKIGLNHKNQAVNLHTIMKKRRKRKISLIVVCACLLACQSNAQSGIREMRPARQGFIELKAGTTRTMGLQMANSHSDFLALFQPPRLGLVVLPADFYSERMGFFCKKEWGFEKTTHIPLRFRLGSLENCNYLEGKK
jgi:hypothetical protein